MKLNAMVRTGKLNLIIYLLFIAMIISCRWYFKTTTDSFEARKTSDAFQRGKNLTFIVCADCHYDPKTGKLSGKSLNDLPKIAGHLYSANLTQSKTNGIPPQYTYAELFYLLKRGIGNFSQSAFATAVREGIAPSGRKLSPPMGKFKSLTDKQMNAIYAYLRSLPPVHHQVKRRSSFQYKPKADDFIDTIS